MGKMPGGHVTPTRRALLALTMSLTLHRSSAWLVSAPFVFALPTACSRAFSTVLVFPSSAATCTAQASRPATSHRMAQVVMSGATDSGLTVKQRTGRKLGGDMQSKAVESTDGEWPKTAEEQALENLPAGATKCWRPTADDVDRISWGKPAKKKMTGSRGVPHRLNDEERRLYDFARRKGFVEIGGSGWRKQRRGAPLVNTYRNWCDARAVPAVYLFKGKEGVDEVVLDISPLRHPDKFLALATQCAAAAPGGVVEALENGLDPSDWSQESVADEKACSTLDVVEEAAMGSSGGSEEGDAVAGLMSGELKEGYVTQPIHRLPMYTVSWTMERAAAKTLAGRLGTAFSCMEIGAKARNSSRDRGMPMVKPGKSRQHGGFGIGSKNNKNGGRKGRDSSG